MLWWICYWVVKPSCICQITMCCMLEVKFFYIIFYKMSCLYTNVPALKAAMKWDEESYGLEYDLALL